MTPHVITIAKKTEAAVLTLKVHFLYPDLFPVHVFLQILEEIAVEFQKDVPIVTKNVKRDLVKNFLCLQIQDKFNSKSALLILIEIKSYHIFEIHIFIVKDSQHPFLISEVWRKKTRHIQKFANDKKSTFFVDPCEIWWKWSPHEMIIFIKFHEDWTKTVDFSLTANIWKCLVFFLQTFRLFANHTIRWLLKEFPLSFRFESPTYLRHSPITSWVFPVTRFFPAVPKITL